MLNGRGQKVDGLEDLEIALGVPTPLRAVDDFAGLFVPCDFLEGEGSA